jgi:hypothetical protein
MASIAPSPTRTTPRTHRAWRTARSDLAKAAASIARTASEARHRYRRPSLVISSFGCLDAAAWTTFGLGAGLLALGVSLFVFEMIGDDE